MKTKIFLLMLTGCYITHNTYTQSPSWREMEDSNKWNIAVAMNSVEAQMGQPLFDSWMFAYTNLYGYFGDRKDNSLSLGILPQYSLSNLTALRCEFGFTRFFLVSHFNGINDSNATNETLIKDDTLKQNIYKFTPGIQWRFVRTNTIDAHVGFVASYQKYSEATWSDRLENNQTGEWERWSAKLPGGFSSGIGAYAGFSVRLFKRLSVGGELCYLFSYYKLGGRYTGLHEAPNNPSVSFPSVVTI